MPTRSKSPGARWRPMTLRDASRMNPAGRVLAGAATYAVTGLLGVVYSTQAPTLTAAMAWVVGTDLAFAWPAGRWARAGKGTLNGAAAVCLGTLLGSLLMVGAAARGWGDGLAVLALLFPHFAALLP